MAIQPFTINVPQATLDDLLKRLARTRWITPIDNVGWDYGASLDYMKELVDYWQHEYDWRAQEAALNQWPQFRAEIDGLGIHFIHVRGKGPNPTPLIISHGWPGSFFEIAKLIPLLTDPASHGGDPADAFDVVIPSLPGFGFSDTPPQRGEMSSQRTADRWAKLMSLLGYEKFAAAGGDLGAIVSQSFAENYPDRLIGIHLTYIGHYMQTPDPATFSEAEKRYRGAIQGWTFREGAYFMIHSTKPQTLSYEVTDSPAGLAAWITEKFQSWTGGEGVIERAVTKDELLTNIMLYWVTGTIGSSFRAYAEDTAKTLEPLPPVPAAFAAFPKDLNPPPREWVERRVNLQHWTEMPRGGHFAAMEQPELLANDMRAFLHQLRTVA